MRLRDRCCTRLNLTRDWKKLVSESMRRREREADTGARCRRVSAGARAPLGIMRSPARSVSRILVAGRLSLQAALGLSGGSPWNSTPRPGHGHQFSKRTRGFALSSS